MVGLVRIAALSLLTLVAISSLASAHTIAVSKGEAIELEITVSRDPTAEQSAVIFSAYEANGTVIARFRSDCVDAGRSRMWTLSQSRDPEGGSI